MKKTYIAGLLLTLSLGFVDGVGAEPTSLEKMHVAFVGKPSTSRIKSLMDVALKQYGLPATEENYNRYGSVLVVLRKHAGVSEMEILSYTVRTGNQGTKLQEMMAISATFLSSQ